MRSKPYNVILIVNEKDGKIVSVECHDCAACQGGCKHSVAFLMWMHRRREEPSCTSVECYWKKSKLVQVGTTIKFIKAKELSKNQMSLNVDLAENMIFDKFIEEAMKRRISNCQILKHLPDYEIQDLKMFSLHYLFVEV